MLFKEVIHIYSENHTKPINTKCRVTDCYAGGKFHSYEWALKG
jgi:hypothetical protein